MRTILGEAVTQAVKQLFLSACRMPERGALAAIESALKKETSAPAKEALRQLVENARIARQTGMPYCQDTGMAVVFVELGQDVRIEGNLSEAIHEGVRQAYEEGYFRKSVRDPLTGQNTGDNTPAIIHYDVVPGDKLRITAAPKGFGSENMSRIYMLKPADDEEGVKQAVLETVKSAGPNACPPMVVGVGIGGSFEKCALLAKYALTRDINIRSDKPHIRRLEEELLAAINSLGIGPAGLGGGITALAVNIETYPTHIAGLPVAVNIGCHVNRHVTRSI